MACVVGGNLDALVLDGLLQGHGGDLLGCSFGLGCTVYVDILLVFLLLEVPHHLPVVLQHVGDHGLGRHGRVDGSTVLEELGQVRQSTTVIQMEVSDDDHIDIVVNIALAANVPEVGILLHVRVLHVDARVEYHGPVLDFYYDAGTPNILAGAQRSDVDFLCCLLFHSGGK